MSGVRILPEILSNKIAAGEVVERPASVVKELLENALDAGSTRIMIEIETGGRSLIRVSDNGCGMNHDDALLSVERYATSKIHNEHDLFRIKTLGFRGEALPSIASVSRFTLVSRDQDSEAGTQIHIKGGKITHVAEIGAPVGTMLTVRNLFFNTPARRKFLKSTATETGHIADCLTRIGLAAPGVQFRLLHNKKIIKNWPVVSDAAERVFAVLGRGGAGHFFQIAAETPAVSVKGWISSPHITRSTSRSLYLYVNSRSVQNRAIQHALFEGYRGRLVKGQFPLGVLFVQAPFDQVDVNVHPAKNEVRFAQAHMMQEIVIQAVKQGLIQAESSAWSVEKVEDKAAGVAERALPYALFAGASPAAGGAASQTRPVLSGAITIEPARQTDLWEKGGFADLKIIGQLHNTYIVCESDAGVVLIDQHAAHERVVYEQLRKLTYQVQPASQRLLVPETIETGFREAEILVGLISHLRTLGLEIDPFGGNTFVIKAVPAPLAGKEIGALVIEIVEKIAARGVSAGLEQAIRQSLMVMACHGAIRANQALTDKEMQTLLVQLDQCDEPAHCPHGRPTWVTWSRKDLEKAFKRSV